VTDFFKLIFYELVARLCIVMLGVAYIIIGLINPETAHDALEKAYERKKV
jgi:hypothetical protein